MDTSKHDFGGLFAQLGLPNDLPAMKAFVASHTLPAGVALAEAKFWNPSQADFLAEELAEDGDWAEVVDALALLLSEK
ncbi:DUF2789 domain-containing protein [Chitinimonas sp. BJB300]|uniref:DUF2789 domain-containing protein n=1 Tax=Chitinimonas sp. BJB300 TaxID=1559339 RepID=UPI000C0EF5DD|nr:DUF2789 domain-containing protein [Chitinimonas sp. BJB300]PHV11638.1 hypothetical protein CSQ89_09895 [Chitinimonas sp. BJB300]TSJ85594.1 DUF2789 domain-containing protein [Chitinimonas sp. BJB300]